MVLLTLTPAMVAALQRLKDAGVQAESIGCSGEPSLECCVVGQSIAHGQVIEIAEKIKTAYSESSAAIDVDLSVFSLDSLLRGSQLYRLSKPSKQQPVCCSSGEEMRTDSLQSSEYKALMARLRQEEELRAYDRMTTSVRPEETFTQRFPNSQHAHLFPTSQADIGDEDEISFADLNRQLALIVNILLSIVACSAALWIAARHWSVPSRLALSMGGSGTIGVAEVVVYAGYLRRIKEAKLKGKREVETKTVMDTWVIGGPSKEAQDREKISSIEPNKSETTLRRRRDISTKT